MGVRRIRGGLLGSLSLLGATALLGLAPGCSEESSGSAENNVNTAKPHVAALSTYSASLGTPVDVIIANPPDATARKFELIFQGTFKRADGKDEKVTLSQPTARTEAGLIRWTSFGPFTNPFSAKDPDIGTFTGTVGVKVTQEDGTEVNDEDPLPISFEVKPSIIITELQPKEASCGAPAQRLIGGMGYKLKATTIGFKATSIEYAIKIPGTVPDVNGRPVMDVDSSGQPKYRTTNLVIDPTIPPSNESKQAFVLPPVPEAVPSYGVVFAVIAKDAEGKKIASTFGMKASRPIELSYDGRYELAQVYAPKPVSSCIPGGQSGRNVDYSEAQQETRTRSLQITLSKNWLKSDQNNWSTSDGKTVETSKSNTDGYSNTKETANSFSFTQNHSDTTGVSFTSSTGETVGVEGKVGFKPFGLGAEVGVRGEKRWDRSSTNSSSSTDGWSKTNTSTESNAATTSHSTATTDSTAVTKTDTKGGSQSEDKGGAEANSDHWEVSSSDTIQRGFSASVIAGTYGVFYRQLARYTQKAFVMVYDMCGEGQVVGDVTMQDYVWAPDLALSKTCPPLPQSNFPQAQCFLPPCDP
jgi:hypothetical protein